MRGTAVPGAGPTRRARYKSTACPRGCGEEGMSPDPQHCAAVECQAARDNPLVLLPITPCSSLAELCGGCRTPSPIAEEGVVT